PRSTLFPYTTLFRSLGKRFGHCRPAGHLAGVQPNAFYPETGDGARADKRFILAKLDQHIVLPAVKPVRQGSRIEDPVFFHPVFLDRKSTRLNSSHVS